jgi:chorismate lyase / 3-hydroxybenzoate synthase
VIIPTTLRTAQESPPIAFQRICDFSLEEQSRRHLLGGLRFGRSTGALPAPLLSSQRDVFDAWLSAQEVGPVQQHGYVRYATDGHWLYGSVEIDDSVMGLQAAAQRAYGDLFEVLASSPCVHLLRLWNYFSNMNLETQGLERYRQFNIGRQSAFLHAQRGVLEGAPAACALGLASGPLRVHFLAARHAPLAIENPRQVSAYRYPDAYGPRAPVFSRAALAAAGQGRCALFISGTASIVGHLSMHVGDVRAQTQESLLNIETLRVLAQEHAQADFAADELIYTLYLRRAQDLNVVREVFEQRVGPQSRAAAQAVYLQADVCRAELLVEIEAHGFVSAGSIT